MTEEEQIHIDPAKQASYNAGLALSNQIVQLLINASISCTNDEQLPSFLSLKEVKKTIVASLTKEEKEDMTQREDKIFTNLTIVTNFDPDFGDSRKVAAYYRVKRILAKQIDSYHEQIMILLYKYGYSISSKVDRTNLNQ